MITPSRFHKYQQVLSHRQPDLRVIAEQVHKPHNIAAIMRTLDAVGGAHLHMVWPWRAQRWPRGSSKGSERFVELHKHTQVDEPVRELQGHGYKVFAAHFSDQAIDFRKVDYREPCAILMGSEKYGVTQESAKLADQHIIIPMQGMVSSLNVSVAASIILQEAHRQRWLAGMYDVCRLSAEEFHYFLFRWTHPIFAAKCDALGLPYPQMDDAANIVAPETWWQTMRQFQADLPVSELSAGKDGLV